MVSKVIPSSVASGSAFVADPRLASVLSDRATGVAASCSVRTGEMATSFFGRRVTAILQRSSQRADPRFRRGFSSRVRDSLETPGVAKETEEDLTLFTPFKIGPYEISHRFVSLLRNFLEIRGLRYCESVLRGTLHKVLCWPLEDWLLFQLASGGFPIRVFSSSTFSHAVRFSLI